MGSWGYGVLDSDSASDVLGDLAGICGAEVIEYGAPRSAKDLSGYEFSRSGVNASMGAMTRFARRVGARRKDAWPVLATLVMHVGARMSKTLRTNAADALMAARDAVGQEGWRSPIARARAIERSLDQVLHYRAGQPVDQSPPRRSKRRS